MMSVRNHAKKHLSRQMLKSDEMKQVTHSKNLFEEIQELINRTKQILDKAEAEGMPYVSLGAIRELRQTYEFLIKFSTYMREAQKEDREADFWFSVKIIRKRLTDEEVLLLNKLIQKMNREIPANTDVLKDAGISSYNRYDSEDDDDDLVSKKRSRFRRRNKEVKCDFEDEEKEETSEDDGAGEGGKHEESTKAGETKKGKAKGKALKDTDSIQGRDMCPGLSSIGKTRDGRTVFDL